MTTLEQALHVFRKDARHLRWEIAGVALLLLLLIFTGVQSWEAMQERGGPGGGDDEPLSVVLALVWSLLIARVIQTEALPGDRHFWLTRPYSRPGLVLSKALFIAAFINLPFLAAQATIVLATGLPLTAYLGELLWTQVLLTLLLLMPVAAIAALTRNLAQFLPAAAVAAGLLAPLVFGHNSLGDLEWIRSLLGFLIAAAIAGFVLWRQYRLRRSGHAALLALGATFAGLLLYLSFPHSLAFAIQSRVLGSPEARFGIRLGTGAARKVEPNAPAVTPNRYRQRLALPLSVTGAAPGDLRIGSARMTIKTLSGISRHPSSRVSLEGPQLVQKTSIDRTFFDAAKESPVNLRTEFSLVQFGNQPSAAVPLDGTPVFIPGLGQCGIVAGYDHRRFVCRSAFRDPKPFLADRLTPEDDHGWRDRYSPFPVRLRIYPIVARTYELTGQAAGALAPTTPEQPLVLMVRDPVAFFRYTMEAANVRLADYAFAEPAKDPDEE